MALVVWLPRGHDPCGVMGHAWVVWAGVAWCPLCLTAVLVLSPP